MLQAFYNSFEDVGTQMHEYIPYKRSVLAGKMRDLLGTSFVEEIRGILLDHQSGGVNHDSMSGTYYANYATFSVNDTDNSDSYLRQAYRLFTLHTAGTFVDEPTDWLLMMKMDERNAIGGESPSSKNVRQTVQ